MKKKRKVIGWREWVGLPDLGIDAIKAKIDTGATTSSLHALDIKTFQREGQEFARFQIQPFQMNTKVTVQAEAPLLEYRTVRSSNGYESSRPVILTKIVLFDEIWSIELTLANREQMGLRMLIGRRAIQKRFLVDPGSSYRDSARVPNDPRPASN